MYEGGREESNDNFTNALINGASRDKEQGSNHSAQGQYDGIVPQRHTTDPVFLLGIIGLWVAMTVIGATGCQNGNPAILTSPINDQGQICGLDSAVANQPYFYSVLTSGIGVCTYGCPGNNSAFTSTEPDDYYCMNFVTSQGLSDSQLSAYISSYCFSDGSFQIDSNCGCMLKLQTVSQFHRCSFTDTTIANQFKTQKIKNSLTNFIADMLTVKGIIFGYGIAATVVLSLIYTSILRHEWVASLCIWTMMLGMLALLAILCFCAYNTASQWKNSNPQSHSNDEIVAMQVCSILLLVFGVLWALFMTLSAKSIQLAIKLMSMAAECIEDLPCILLTPIIKATGLVLFLVPWAFYVLFIASTGSFKTSTATIYSSGGSSIDYSYQTYSISSDSQGQLIFMFFCYLWTTEFVVATGIIVVSITTANWYFSKPDQRQSKGAYQDWLSGWHDTLRFHLGTAAFGSLIIAIVQMIRAIVKYIEKQVKSTNDNALVKCVFCIVNCLLASLECCIKFISTNAYIQTAIHSNSLCFAAKDAFFLISRNVLTIGSLEAVTHLALTVGLVLIVFLTGASTYFILSTFYQESLNGLIGPTLMTMFISYTVASMFCSVFQSIAETLVQCYVTDQENHNGVPEYASSTMITFIDTHKMTKEQYDKENNIEAGPVKSSGKTAQPGM